MLDIPGHLCSGRNKILEAFRMNDSKILIENMSTRDLYIFKDFKVCLQYEQIIYTYRLVYRKENHACVVFHLRQCKFKVISNTSKQITSTCRCTCMVYMKGVTNRYKQITYNPIAMTDTVGPIACLKHSLRMHGTNPVVSLQDKSSAFRSLSIN